MNQISDFLINKGFTEDELQNLSVRYKRNKDEKWRAVYGLDQDMQDTLRHGLYVNGPLKGHQVFIYYQRGTCIFILLISGYHGMEK